MLEVVDKQALITIWTKIKEYISKQLESVNTSYILRFNNIGYHTQNKKDVVSVSFVLNKAIKDISDDHQLVVYKRNGTPKLFDTTNPRTNKNAKCWSRLNKSKRPVVNQITTLAACKGVQPITHAIYDIKPNKKIIIFPTTELNIIFRTRIYVSKNNKVIYARIGNKRVVLGVKSTKPGIAFSDNTNVKHKSFILGFGITNPKKQRLSNIIPFRIKLITKGEGNVNTIVNSLTYKITPLISEY